MPSLKILYAHGFASGPLSKKGVAVREHLAERGLSVELLDLRVPSPTGLRLSRMIEVVRDAIGDADRALAIGSSLGGLSVAHAAERDPRIVATVLLAPAFRIAERWRARMGEADWAKWQRDGSFAYEDHATGGTLDVDFGFIEDAARVDRDWPDVRVPTTIIHGRNDESVDPELSRTYAATRSNVRLLEVEDDHQLLRSLDVICAEIDRAIASL
jgi:pimeloyl-ACP methyl ester carboxylesterase